MPAVTNPKQTTPRALRGVCAYANHLLMQEKVIAKIQFCLFLILASTTGYSQTLQFTKASPQPSLIDVWAGTFACGDVDGDGDKDLFMTGITPSRQTKLYLNNGTGAFTESPTSFPITSNTQAILKDLDNDGDLDLFLSGQNPSNVVLTDIYRNNGAGVFTQITNNALPKFANKGGAAIEDVDNDGDQDIFITASTTSGFVADVYLNDGNAVFSAQGSSAFSAVKGAAEFIDIENDGDKDLIVVGDDAGNVSSIKLYQNNGLGLFTLNTNSTFAATPGFDIDVADTDNDGDFDFLVNGNYQNFLYTNNGSGVFSQITTSLQQTFGGENAIADLDNDGDQDMIIVGTQRGGLPNIYNIVYQNTGNNVFVPVDTLGGEYIADCVVDDINGDGFKDIIIQGFVNQTNVYWNTSTITSTTDIVSPEDASILYPNPTNNLVNFNLNGNEGRVSLYNSFGQEVLSKKVNSQDFVLDVSNLPNGVYTVRLSTAKAKAVKLVKF